MQKPKNILVPFAGGTQEDFETIVQPHGAIFTVPLKQIWDVNELLYLLVWRDMKMRYQQAIVGAGWAILKPLLLMLVFVFVFGVFIKVPTGNIPYPIVAYTGLLPWTLVTTVIGSASASLLSNADILTKVYFPRILIPLSASIGGLIDLVISLPILLGLMVWFGIPLTPRVLMLPLFLGLIFVLAFGVGVILSALHVKYHDIGMLVPIILQVWLYGTPIIYPLELVPARFLTLYSLNPMVGLLQGVRWSLIDAASPTPFMLVVSCVATAVILVGSVLFFQYSEDTFADVV